MLLLSCSFPMESVLAVTPFSLTGKNIIPGGEQQLSGIVRND